MRKFPLINQKQCKTRFTQDQDETVCKKLVRRGPKIDLSNGEVKVTLIKQITLSTNFTGKLTPQIEVFKLKWNVTKIPGDTTSSLRCRSN
jgi:hypothetical protein